MRAYSVETPVPPEWRAEAIRLARNLKRGQVRKGGAFRPSDIRRLLIEQDFRCAITGRPFDLSGGLRAPWRASIDRIDCARPYQRGNVRLVALVVNMAMGAWGEGTLRELAALLAPEYRPAPASRTFVDRLRKALKALPANDLRLTLPDEGST